MIYFGKNLLLLLLLFFSSCKTKSYNSAATSSYPQPNMMSAQIVKGKLQITNKWHINFSGYLAKKKVSNFKIPRFYLYESYQQVKLFNPSIFSISYLLQPAIINSDANIIGENNRKIKDGCYAFLLSQKQGYINYSFYISIQPNVKLDALNIPQIKNTEYDKVASGGQLCIINSYLSSIKLQTKYVSLKQSKSNFLSFLLRSGFAQKPQALSAIKYLQKTKNIKFTKDDIKKLPSSKFKLAVFEEGDLAALFGDEEPESVGNKSAPTSKTEVGAASDSQPQLSLQLDRGRDAASYHEMTRRMEPEKNTTDTNEQPLTKEDLIHKLESITDKDLEDFTQAINSPSTLMASSSFLHNENFPYTALKQLKNGEIDNLEFATIMRIWSFKDVNPPPTFVSFSDYLTDNRAQDLVANIKIAGVEVIDNYDKKILSLEAHMKQLTTSDRPLEQGFWKVKDTTDYQTYDPDAKQDLQIKMQTASTTIERLEAVQLLFNKETVTQRVSATGMQWFTPKLMPGETKQWIVPSFELQQQVLNTMFEDEAITLNPVIGASSVQDIKLGSALRHRDIAIPFPGFKLPPTADHFAAPHDLDFMIHDWYHAVRSSCISKKDSSNFVAIGEQLYELQQSFSFDIRLLTAIEERLTKGLRIDGEIERFNQESSSHLFEKFPPQAQQIGKGTITDVITYVKTLRKAIGQVKFSLWDMEAMPYKGKDTILGDMDAMPSKGIASIEYRKIYSIFKSVSNHIKSLKITPDGIGFFDDEDSSVALESEIVRRVLETPNINIDRKEFQEFQKIIRDDFSSYSHLPLFNSIVYFK